jgi:hypothetical protein
MQLRAFRIRLTRSSMAGVLRLAPLVALAGASLAAMSGCGSLGTHPACDLIAVSSVNIEIVDLAGDPLAADTLTYTIDGGDEQEGYCADEECTIWTAGSEEIGEFHIVAGLCGSFAEETVTVEPGECHVISQEIVLELDPAACDTGD